MITDSQGAEFLLNFAGYLPTWRLEDVTLLVEVGLDYFGVYRFSKSFHTLSDHLVSIFLIASENVAQESVATASSNFKFDENSSSSITVTNDKATTSLLKNLSHILKILMSNSIIQPF